MNQITKFKAISNIMSATDSQLLKFLAIQKFEEITKSTGDVEIALEVLESSIALVDDVNHAENDVLEVDSEVRNSKLTRRNLVRDGKVK